MNDFELKNTIHILGHLPQFYLFKKITLPMKEGLSDHGIDQTKNGAYSLQADRKRISIVYLSEKFRRYEAGRVLPRGVY